MLKTSVQAPPDCATLVRKILEQDACGVEDLYSIIAIAAPANFARIRKKDSIEDEVHEILLIVLEAIYRGDLREPARLMGFVRTVARRRAVAHIRGNIIHRRRFLPQADSAVSSQPTPEERLADRERVQRLNLVLKRLRSRDREILLRFYYLEQRPDRICADMRLTPTQFRLFKSRALARCFELSRR